MTPGQVHPAEVEARRALVLHDRPLVVDLITLTLNHGVFEVRAATNLDDARTILTEWRPHMSVIDMDHDDSTALLQVLGASNTLRGAVTPVLGLTRRGDLKTKLRAFDLGVDDILTMPFSPEELLARSIVITRRASGSDRPIIPPSGSARWRSTSSIARCAPVTRSCTSPASSRACSTCSPAAAGGS